MLFFLFYFFNFRCKFVLITSSTDVSRLQSPRESRTVQNYKTFKTKSYSQDAVRVNKTNAIGKCNSVNRSLCSRHRLIRQRLKFNIFIRIIQSDELIVHFNIESQWNVSRETAQIKQSVELSVVELRSTYRTESFKRQVVPKENAKPNILNGRLVYNWQCHVGKFGEVSSVHGN